MIEWREQRRCFLPVREAGEGMSEPLEACPLCGGPAVGPDNITKLQGARTPLWKIGCVAFCISLIRHTKKDAIKDWNSRPGEQVLLDEIAVLKSKLQISEGRVEGMKEGMKP